MKNPPKPTDQPPEITPEFRWFLRGAAIIPVLIVWPMIVCFGIQLIPERFQTTRLETGIMSSAILAFIAMAVACVFCLGCAFPEKK